MEMKKWSVGDWIYLFDPADKEESKEAHKISEVRENGIRVAMYNDIYEEDWFEPIPLTTEILEKNGFEREKYTIDIAEAQEIEYDGYRYILCKNGVQYDIILTDSFGGYFDLEIESSHRDEDGERILISSKLSLDYVEYVHQLQHALRLVGIEKEIEV